MGNDKFKLVETMFKKGQSINSIAKELKLTKSRISRHLKKEGYTIEPAFQLSPEAQLTLNSKLKSAAHDYLTHQLTVKKAAKNNNLNYYTFKNYLEDSNIKIKKYINRQYFFDERIFKDINTEEKAYWLGFLYADGSIIGNERACEVAQSSANVDHLEKFRDFIGASYPLKVKCSGNHKAYVYKINSKRFVKDLIDKGCVARKSLVLTFPDEKIVPSYLKMHFIRGYFDGDGSVGEYEGGYRVSFVGTKPFLEEIQSVLQTNYSYREKGNAYAFGTGGYEKVEELLNKLYRHATIYMTSKYKIYQQLVERNKLTKLQKQLNKQSQLALYQQAEQLYLNNMSIPEIERQIPSINRDVLPYYLKTQGHYGFARQLSEEEKKIKNIKLAKGLKYYLSGEKVSMAARKANIGLKPLKLHLHEQGIEKWYF